MKAFVIKGWRSSGAEFFIGNIERGDGCWDEVSTITNAKLFASIEGADRTIGWLLIGDPQATFVVRTVTVTLGG